MQGPHREVQRGEMQPDKPNVVVVYPKGKQRQYHIQTYFLSTGCSLTSVSDMDVKEGMFYLSHSGSIPRFPIWNTISPDASLCPMLRLLTLGAPWCH